MSLRLRHSIGQEQFSAGLFKGVLTGRLLTIPALIALSAFLTYAQESTGELIGKVTLAEDGSPLPGVTVTLTGTAFGKAGFVTTKEGNFRFASLNPGIYSLRFELQGFRTVEQTGIRVSLGTSTPVYVSLEPGVLREEVAVVALTQMIDTRKAAISVNYTNEMITSLPIALRTTEIINMAPGIISAHPQIAGQGSPTLHGFGVQNYRAEYYLDGGSLRSTYGHGDMPTDVSLDRVEEVQVTTTGQDISNVQGGPTINFVSKRGGNKLAGDAYIAVLDKSLQANNKGFPKYMSTPSNQVYKQTDAYGKVYGLGYTENQGIFRTYDYGVSLGGPILTDHLWFFGSWAVVDNWNKDYLGVPAGHFYVPDLYGKLNFQWTTFTAETSYTWRTSEALNTPFFANSPNNRDSKNPIEIFTAQAAVTLRQKLLLSAKFTYFDQPVLLQQANFTPTGAGNTTYEAGRTYNPPGRYYTYNYLKSPPYNTEPTGFWQHYGFVQRRPHIVVEGDYFAENFLGGNHEIKFGFDRNFARFLEEYQAPNSSFVSDYPATASQLAPTYPNGLSYFGTWRTYTDRHGEKRSTRSGIYLQDTMTYGRLAVNAGVRVDWHAWEWSTTLYHAVAPADEPITQWEQWTGEITTPSGRQDIGATFSPRLSITWDLFGTGKDLVKLQYANYAGAVDTLGFRNGFKKGYTRLEFVSIPFVDYNMNYVPDWPTGKFPNAKNEFILNDVLGRWPTPDDILMMIAKGQAEQKVWNAAHRGVPVPWDYYTYPGWYYLGFTGNPLGNKASGSATDTLDSSFKPDRVLEITVGYEKQLSTDISVQIIGAYKREYNFAWWRGYQGTLASYTLMPVDTMKVLGIDPTTGWTVYGNDPSYGAANGYIGFTYGNDYYNYFKGLEFVFNKRFSRGWMLQASLDLQDWRVRYADRAINPDGSANPEGKFARSTLYDYYNDSYVAVGEWLSTEPRQNARWHFKIAGLVRLPFAINVSGFLDARDGYLTDRWLAVNSGQYLPAKTDHYGSWRLPSFWYANFTIDRTFTFSEEVSAKVFATAYNAFNIIEPVGINSTVVPTRWPPTDYPTDVNRPRVVQIGVRFSFR